MNHTGLITEIPDSPAWAENMICDSEVEEVKIKGIAKGAGDIASNAPDMVKWMEGLSCGKIVSADTLRLIRIPNSLHIGQIMLSEAYYADVVSGRYPGVTALDAPQELTFDMHDTLTTPWLA